MKTRIHPKEVKLTVNSECASRRTIGMGIKKSLAALLCFGFLALRVHASPIVYTFTGIGNGQVAGGSAFSNAAFNISVFADTDKVRIIHTPFLERFVIGLSSAFLITGIGSGTFTDLIRIFDNPSGSLVLTDDAYPLSVDNLALYSASFSTYGLTNAFGPVGSAFEPAPGFVMVTTLGTIDITPVGNISFSAMLVPEGNLHGLLLFGSVLLGLGILKKGVTRLS